MSFDESQGAGIPPERRSGLLRQGALSARAGTAPAPANSPAPQPAAPEPEIAEHLPRWRFGKSGYARSGGRARTRDTGKIGGPIGLLLRLALFGVLFVVVWQVQAHRATSQTQTTPAQSVPTADTSNDAQTSVPPGQTALLPPDQVAALFLSAYFTWSGTETNGAYASQWSWMVAPNAQSTLVSAAPRARLDNGADIEAKSFVPTFAADALQVQQQSAQALAHWTIQVIPPSSDQATWQKRTIRATITLAQTDSLWQVTAVTWSSRPA